MKKIMIGSILAVFLLVAISFASAVSSNTANDTKESPLYKIRTRQAISEKITTILENIKTRFLGERIFFSSLKLFDRHLQNLEQILPQTISKICDTAWC